MQKKESIASKSGRQRNNEVGLHPFLKHAASDTCDSDIWPKLKASVFQQEQCDIKEEAERLSMGRRGTETEGEQHSDVTTLNNEMQKICKRY